MVKKSKRKGNGLHQVSFVGGFLIGFLASSLLWFTTLKKQCFGTHFTTDLTLIPHAPVPAQPQLKDDDGWKLVHFFYGNKSNIADYSDIPTDYFTANKWFSQFRQDEVVSKLLQGKRDGFFVDLASNDAVRLSNTYALETFFGWQGLCIEPNPRYWAGLSHRKCHVAGAVVGENNLDEVSFKFPKEKAPHGGIVGNNFDNKVASSGQTRRVYTVKLLDIFKRFNVPKVIDYLSLDVEGAEDFIMRSFPFSDYRFNVLTVERPSASLTRILESNDYILLKALKNRTETLWVHRLVEGRLERSALDIDTQQYKYRERPSRPGSMPRRQ